ncbi:MAG: hypothetical protein AVDCRST_MAG13-3162 [uncultured Solirubrobacteraceae bacterium]|uniref:Uncharacterized protein n=1 Tax=uncultured Solirubrobacteraceae bacterium TaxID=1162706 RepID=A0A6J4T9J2_9ACTN|nr:MAG: hypothetical protein AVDCRST_MAG13-3162 [uncultured Solirubrobacteraceae bacterium]
MATPEALPAAPGVLPETAGVHWRPRADARRLTSRGRLWTLTTVAHVIPFLLTGAGLLLLDPVTLPVALAAWAHAYLIPQAYASRGANVVRPRRFRATQAAQERSVGLLGDLIGHDARALHARTGLVLERGRLGVWLVGPAGALLLRDGGRRVFCWCVRVNDPDLPAGDRIAHLLLALRADEPGFATVANMTFSGAPWRIRRRIPAAMRPAVDAAVAASRAA